MKLQIMTEGAEENLTRLTL